MPISNTFVTFYVSSMYVKCSKTAFLHDDLPPYRFTPIPSPSCASCVLVFCLLYHILPFLLCSMADPPVCIPFGACLPFGRFDPARRLREFCVVDDSRPTYHRDYAVNDHYDDVHIGNLRPYSIFHGFGFISGTAFKPVRDLRASVTATP